MFGVGKKERGKVFGETTLLWFTDHVIAEHYYAHPKDPRKWGALGIYPYIVEQADGTVSLRVSISSWEQSYPNLPRQCISITLNADGFIATRDRDIRSHRRPATVSGANMPVAIPTSPVYSTDFVADAAWLTALTAFAQGGTAILRFSDEMVFRWSDNDCLYDFDFQLGEDNRKIVTDVLAAYAAITGGTPPRPGHQSNIKENAGGPQPQSTNPRVRSVYGPFKLMDNGTIADAQGVALPPGHYQGYRYEQLNSGQLLITSPQGQKSRLRFKDGTWQSRPVATSPAGAAGAPTGEIENWQVLDVIPAAAQSRPSPRPAQKTEGPFILTDGGKISDAEGREVAHGERCKGYMLERVSTGGFVVTSPEGQKTRLVFHENGKWYRRPVLSGPLAAASNEWVEI